MSEREETLPASEQVAQTVVNKLQALKILPARSWGKRTFSDIETIFARDHFADKRSSAVLEKQGSWIARRRWIGFAWYDPEGIEQVTADIRLEQGFHKGDASNENSKEWAPAAIVIRARANNRMVFNIQDHETIEALLSLADGKPLFE